MSAKREREKRQAERLEAERAAGSEERRRRLIQLGSAAAFLALVVVAVLIVISQTQTDGGDTDLEKVAEVKAELKGIPQRGLVLGDPDAKVTLYEFGDLKCPVCKAFSEEVIPSIIDSRVRSGEAKLEFKNFTIIDEQSTPAGAAAIAAGAQGRGWNFIELFYRNQGPETSSYVSDDFLTEVARGAGVSDIARWNQDRKDPETIAEVERTTTEAERIGLTGTPSFAVQGPGSDGLESLGTPGSAGDLEAAIEAAAG
jgi:protein-disulfide isomerase